MKKLSRNQVIDLIESASARGDVKAALRLYVENSISKSAYDKAWESGQRLKKLIDSRKANKTNGNT